MTASRLRPLASVVIPSIGRTESLSRCLTSVFRQTLGRDAYEVIVVDDASNSDYSWLPESVLLLRLPTWGGPGGARNAGVDAANADVVAFLDDDVTVSSTWLAEVMESLELHPEASAVGSYLRPPDAMLASSAPARLEFSGLVAAGCFGPATVARADRSAAWGTNNLAYRREAFLALGGIPRTYQRRRGSRPRITRRSRRTPNRLHRLSVYALALVHMA